MNTNFASSITRFLLCLAFCAYGFTLSAQTDLKVKLIFKNVSPYPASWATDGATGSLIITNTSKDTKDVRISTTLNKDGTLLGATDVNKMDTKSIPPGTTIFRVEDVYPLSAAIYYGNDNINGVIQTGRIPEGLYEICTKLVDPATHADLSAPQCTFFNIISYSPATPILPRDRAVISKDEAKMMKFNFAPIAPKPATAVIYTLNIYEILPNEAPSQARLHPPLVQEVVKTGYSITWPMSAQPPEPGKKYLWEITDEDKQGNKISDQGRSESFQFTVGNVLRSAIVTNVTVGSIVCAGTDASGIPKYSVVLNYQNNSPNGQPNHLGATTTGPPYFFQPTYGTYWSVPSANGTISGISPSASANAAIPNAGSIPITFSIASNAASATVQIQSCNIDADKQNKADGVDNVVLNFPHCDTPCKCDSTNNTWASAPNSIKFSNLVLTKFGNCGGPQITLPAGSYAITLPAYNCIPTTCNASYPWSVNGVPQGGSLGLTKPLIVTAGTYNLIFTPTCGGRVCAICTLTVVVQDTSCTCKGWDPNVRKAVTMSPSTGSPSRPCGGTFNISGLKTETFTFPNYVCTKPDCRPTYTWTVAPSNGIPVGGGAGNTFPYTFDSCGYYTFTVKAFCDHHLCDSCTVHVQVDSCNKLCLCAGWSGVTVLQRGCPPIYVNSSTSDALHYTACNCGKIVINANCICKPCATCNPCPSANVHIVVTGPSGFYITQPLPGASFTPIGNGSYHVTLSGNCGVKDSCTFNFYIDVKDCPDTCHCNRWNYDINPNVITMSPSNGTPAQPCGGIFHINGPGTRTFSFPGYLCSKRDCSPLYKWTLTPPNGVPVAGGLGNTFSYTFDSCGYYTFKVMAFCNNHLCDSCTLHVQVDSCRKPCNCGIGWTTTKVQMSSSSGTVTKNCGGTFPSVRAPKTVNFTFPGYQCSPTRCNASYTWTLTPPAGVAPASGTGNQFPYSFVSCGYYTFTVRAFCGDHFCDSCTVHVSVDSCDTACHCNHIIGLWAQNPITFTGSSVTRSGNCGGPAITLPAGSYSVNLPSYNCSPSTCPPTYPWSVNGTPQPSLGQVKTVIFTSGTYTLNFWVLCGGRDSCARCTITVIVGDSSCNCRGWRGKDVHMTTSSGTVTRTCGQPFPAVRAPQTINLSFPTYQCTPASCTATYTWKLTPPAGVTPASGTGNQFSYSLSSCGLYTFTSYAYCGGHLCDSCKAFVGVDSCDRPCCPGTWGDLSYTYTAANKVPRTVPLHCNSDSVIQVACHQNYTINASYSCNSTSCPGNVTFSISPAAGATITPVTGGAIFNANSSGTYTVTIYGMCGGHKCDSCRIRFKVNCDTSCCGAWDMGPGHFEYFNGVLPIGTNFTCNGWAVSTVYDYHPVYFTRNYVCSGNCTPVYSWELRNSLNNTVSSGSGVLTMPIIFTPTAPDTYEFIAYARCGGKICDSCIIHFVTKDTARNSCCPGSWGPLSYTYKNPLGTNTVPVKVPLPCNSDSVVNILCHQNYTINASYTCNNNATCPGSVAYSIFPTPGATITPVTGGAIFNAAASGSYTVTIYGMCGDHKCDSCKIHFRVRCDSSCCSGSSWGDKYYTYTPVNTSGGIPTPLKGYIFCNQNMDIPVSCNQNVPITASYNCSKPNCNGHVAFSIYPTTGATITPVIGGAIFNATGSGEYTITMYGICGNDTCDRCFFHFYIGKCDSPCIQRNIVICDTNGNPLIDGGGTWSSGNGTIATIDGGGTWSSGNGTTATTIGGGTWNRGKGMTGNTGTTPGLYASADSPCIAAGPYTFRLNPALTPPSTMVSYLLTTMPGNVTITSGTLAYSALIAHVFNIPANSCGDHESFKLTLTWGGSPLSAPCSDTLTGKICKTSCCDFVKLKSMTKSRSGDILNFTTTFSMPTVPVTCSQVKVQILQVNYNGIAEPLANIKPLSLYCPFLIPGTKDPAITNWGSALWFIGLPPFSASPIIFSGSIIHMVGMTDLTKVKLILRFTFYKAAGTCPEAICEKDIDFANATITTSGGSVPAGAIEKK